MSWKFEDPNGQCPFYIEEGSKTVTCEGVLPKESTMIHRWPSKAKKTEMKEQYCCGAWKTCPVARALCMKYDYEP